MFDSLLPWLQSRGLAGTHAQWVVMCVEVVTVIVIAVLANILTKRLAVRQLQRWTARSPTTWDDHLVSRKVFLRLSHLAPAVVIYHFAGAVLEGHTGWLAAVQQGSIIYMLAAGTWAVSSLFSALDDILSQTSSGRNLPIKTFVQVAQLLLFGLMGLTVTSLMLGKSPLILFSGLGAMAALLLLVFKDPLMGFVAGIQLSANQMVAIGDWIEMPQYGADGDVIEVALTTVKVQNFDKTIVTIPTYALISGSFKNWRGMTESGGRRIKRAIVIDMASVRFCDDEMLERFSHIQYVADHVSQKEAEIAEWNHTQGVDVSSPVNGRRLTNLGTFRAYVIAYLRHHPMVHQEMTFLVRQLAPTAQGLPIEIYVFSRDQDWANYEGIQADIFDHIIAVVPEFDLGVFQAPSGSDVREALSSSSEKKLRKMHGRRVIGEPFK